MSEQDQLVALRAELYALEQRASRADELRGRARVLSGEIAVATETSQRPALLEERGRLRARVTELEAAIAAARHAASLRPHQTGPAIATRGWPLSATVAGWLLVLIGCPAAFVLFVRVPSAERTWELYLVVLATCLVIAVPAYFGSMSALRRRR